MKTYKCSHGLANDYAGRRVRVYFNLRTKMWSVQSRVRGERPFVLCHAKRVALKGCRPIISQAGRRRVLKEKRKNVHAYIEGFICRPDWKHKPNRQITYNPYKYKSFVFVNNVKCTLEYSCACWFASNGKVWVV